ncbi:MAG: hypothetical protein RBU30_15125 [Polyangia bacterium]|jgi:hypothetical protein|nr:hypothetical protein [Polyangia bacterium]
MVVLALVLLGTAGCRARPGLEPLFDAGPFPDASLPDAFAPDCELSFAACRLSGGPVKVGDQLDGPRVVWTGRELIVAFDDVWASGDWTVALAGYSLGAEERFRLPVGRQQDPYLTWHPQLGVGLVATDWGLRWLDGEGHPTGRFQDGGEDRYRWYRAAAAAPVPDGFLVAAGAWGYAEDPGLMQRVRVGRSSASFSWHTLESGGLWPRPAFAVSPRDGMARWLAAVRHEGPHGMLYRVDGQTLRQEAELDDLLPEGESAEVEAITEKDGDLLILYGNRLTGTQTWALWLVRLTPSFPEPPIQVEHHRIDVAPNGPDGTLLHLGEEVLLGSATIDRDYRVTVAPLVLDPPGGESPIGEPRIVVTSAFSRSPSMTATPRGFAIACFEDDSVSLAVYDCCVE